jgi:hypothetical protein
MPSARMASASVSIALPATSKGHHPRHALRAANTHKATTVQATKLSKLAVTTRLIRLMGKITDSIAVLAQAT